MLLFKSNMYYSSNLLWITAFQFYVHNWLTSAHLRVYLVNLHQPGKKRQESVTICNLLVALGMAEPEGIKTFGPFIMLVTFLSDLSWAKALARSATFQGNLCPFNNGGVLALKQYFLCKRCGFRYHSPLFIRKSGMDCWRGEQTMIENYF